MNMAHWTRRGRIGQLIGDAALGLALFAVMVSIGNACGNARAETRPARDAAVYATASPAGDASATIVGLVSQATPNSFALPRPVAFYKNDEVVLGMLAMVFAALFALNLGFWRHLRSTYAPLTPAD